MKNLRVPSLLLMVGMLLSGAQFAPLAPVALSPEPLKIKLPAPAFSAAGAFKKAARKKQSHLYDLEKRFRIQSALSMSA